MRNTTLFTSFIAAGLLATAPAFSGQWDGNPDMQDSILNNLDQPAYVGTGMSEARPTWDFYGAFGGSDIAPHGFIVGNAAPEKGKGDRYGSVLLDVRQ